MHFGKNLKRLRRDRGWTQGQLAQNADLRVTHVPNLERSKGDPKLSTIYKLINALECSFDALLMDSDKVSIDRLAAASLERINQLPETHKYILMDIIDAYCIRHSLQSQFKRDDEFRVMLYKDKPTSLISEEELINKIKA